MIGKLPANVRLSNDSRLPCTSHCDTLRSTITQVKLTAWGAEIEANQRFIHVVFIDRSVRVGKPVRSLQMVVAQDVERVKEEKRVNSGQGDYMQRIFRPEATVFILSEIYLIRNRPGRLRPEDPLPVVTPSPPFTRFPSLTRFTIVYRSSSSRMMFSGIEAAAETSYNSTTCIAPRTSTY